MVLEVYLDLLSQPCRAVKILLDTTNIPHRVRTVALRKGENRSPEFRQLNPMMKVPVLVDDKFVLTESDAILKYLVTQYEVPAHWYPLQPERRARVDEYLSWHQTNTRPHAAKVFLLEVLLPSRGGAVDRGRRRGPRAAGRGADAAGRHAGHAGAHVPAAPALPVRRRHQRGRPAGRVRTHAAARWRQRRAAAAPPAAELEEPRAVGGGRGLRASARRPVRRPGPAASTAVTRSEVPAPSPHNDQ